LLKTHSTSMDVADKGVDQICNTTGSTGETNLGWTDNPLPFVRDVDKCAITHTTDQEHQEQTPDLC
jgi:hypothetical protein